LDDRGDGEVAGGCAASQFEASMPLWAQSETLPFND
jgi:hypothetical protein